MVLAEAEEKDPSAQAELKIRAQQAATHIVGGPPDEVVLVAPGTVPKTASGKIRRAAARDLYLGKNLVLPQRALWWQIARLSFAGLQVRIPQLRRVIGEILYAAWWWTVIATGFLLGWLAVMTLPRLTWRWAAIRALARTALAALRVPLSVSGIEKIPNRAVLAFNHASYMDAIVVAAVLPGEPSYVVKKELASQMLAGALLRRLGVLFLERFEVAESSCRSGSRYCSHRAESPIGIFSGGHIHPQARAFRFLFGCVQSCSAGQAAGLARYPAGNAFDVARRSVVPAMEPNQRQHRGSHSTSRNRSRLSGTASRCRACRDPGGLRRA